MLNTIPLFAARKLLKTSVSGSSFATYTGLCLAARPVIPACPTKRQKQQGYGQRTVLLHMALPPPSCRCCVCVCIYECNGGGAGIQKPVSASTVSSVGNCLRAKQYMAHCTATTSMLVLCVCVCVYIYECTGRGAGRQQPVSASTVPPLGNCFRANTDTNRPAASTNTCVGTVCKPSRPTKFSP